MLPANASTVSGGNPRLFDTIATITCTITNTGNYTAADVAQLYIGIPKGPKKQLRGFAKELVPVGGSVAVSFPLTRRDLSVWDVVRQNWVLVNGTYQVYIGRSVMHTPLQRAMTVLA